MKGIRTTSREHYFRSAVICLLIYCMILNTWLPVVFATPSGGEFKVGGGTIVDGVPNSTVTVNQAQSVIEWGSSGTGGGIDTSSSESLTFLQKEGLGLSNSAVLNRIVSGNPTQFDGTLNGVDMRIFIVNPAGVFFGEGSSVNVNQLVASGLGMSDPDFKNAIDKPMDKMVFSGGSGNVTNDGTINAIDSIYLVGKNVTNNGAILCPDGLVVMAAGDTLRLGQPGSNIIVDMSNISTDLVADNDNVVTNNGTVGEDSSPIGELVLAAGDVFSQAIANVDDVTVIARDDVELTDVAVTGEAEVYSGLTGSNDSTMIVHGSITAGSITLRGGDPANLEDGNHELNVVGELHGTTGDVTVSAREHVTLGGDIVADNGSISAIADCDGLGLGDLSTKGLDAPKGDIELKGINVDVDGTVVAEGNLTIRAMRDDRWISSNVHATGSLHAGGNIDISAREGLTNNTIDPEGKITLDSDVIAGEDLILHNDTEMTASGAKLEAGGDVILANGLYPEGHNGACSELTGYEELAIIAGTAEVVDDGVIYAENTTISVTGSSLTLEQDVDLDLGDFMFSNQENTHLTANSNNGSVTAVDTANGGNDDNAADQWASIEAEAHSDITLQGHSDTRDITTTELHSIDGDIEVTSDLGSVNASGPINADGSTTPGKGNITVEAGANINLAEDVTAAGDIDLIADADGVDGGDLWAGNNLNSGGDLYAEGGESIHIEGDALAQENMTLFAHGSDSGITVDGALTTNNGDIDISSTYYIELGGPVEAHGNLTMSAQGGDYDDSFVYAADALSSLTGYTQIVADRKIELDGPVKAYGDLMLDADIDDNGDGELYAYSTLTSETGSVHVSSSDGTQYLYDNVTAAVDIVLNNNTVFLGDVDQKVDAQTGTITANGWLSKISELGNLYLEAADNILLADYVAVENGGVSIISEDGKIYTQDGVDNDTLNVAIKGYSNQSEGIGVELPYDPDKKAAIVLISKENLNLGEDSALYADGEYLALDESIVEGYAGTDDRAAVNLLNSTEEIGGHDRDEGEPIDVAIYLASKGTDTAAGEGNIDLDVDSVVINGPGTMVVDAYDTITFGDLSEPGGINLLNEFLMYVYMEPEEEEDSIFQISRLEVVSRISEWLDQAVGRLPFAGDPAAIAAFEELIGGDYILRGAGLENNSITDGRAWVLEAMPGLYIPAAPLPEQVEFVISGCPTLIQWTAEELGIEGEMVQVWIVNTLASSRDIQPCDACANLRAAATVLQDVDGTHIAALAQVINEFASSAAPPSEEQMASIADAIANNTESDNAYALAGEYIDALVAYVGILEDLGYSSEDSITVASDKYVAPLAEGDNVGLAAYVAARLTALGG